MKTTTMTTSNHTPIRARFAYKPFSLNDVLYNSDPSAPFEPIVIEAYKELTPEEYDEFTNMFESRDWLTGYGGRANGHRYVVAVSAPGRQTLYVDPSGGDCGRYVGVSTQPEGVLPPPTDEHTAW